MEAEVIYYCEDHDDVDFVALSECFGSPEEVAKDFLSELGANTINKASLVKQRLILFVVIFIIISAVLFISISIHVYYIQQTILDSHYIESITYEGQLTPDMTGATFEAEYYYSENEISD